MKKHIPTEKSEAGQAPSTREEINLKFEALEQRVSAITVPLESNYIKVHGDINNDKVVFYITNKLIGTFAKLVTIGKRGDEIRNISGDGPSPLTLETQILIEEEILNVCKVVLSNKQELMEICTLRAIYIIQENNIMKGGK
ncbi:hypothetical protein [Aquamicrobium sp.]|uniref:hypothetical protein n=1 Tax=Aquamicrobium sp. TaxID=1872579 RepID=UPI002590A33F|nr:hypothetical protein [Aquamicrobium sp.]MCK9549478.1 hypothetical protein [Aquamicrobium sp.]